jgi:hypothetical protein
MELKHVALILIITLVMDIVLMVTRVAEQKVMEPILAVYQIKLSLIILVALRLFALAEQPHVELNLMV